MNGWMMNEWASERGYRMSTDPVDNDPPPQNRLPSCSFPVFIFLSPTVCEEKGGEQIYIVLTVPGVGSSPGTVIFLSQPFHPQWDGCELPRYEGSLPRPAIGCRSPIYQISALGLTRIISPLYRISFLQIATKMSGGWLLEPASDSRLWDSDCE